MSIDLVPSVDPIIGLENVAVSSASVQTGSTIDLQDASGCTVFLIVNAHTSGSFAPIIKLGDLDNGTDAQPVADDRLIAADAQLQDSAETQATLTANGVSKIGLRMPQTKRYLTVDVDATGATVQASVSVLVLKQLTAAN